MDYQFPQQLFPSFCNSGPPDLAHRHCAEAGGWGSYCGVLPQGDGPLSNWTFTAQHQVKGETWTHTEPVVVPLLSPKKAFSRSLTPPDPLDFTEHMQNFYMSYSQDAFGCMNDLLGEHFYFRYGKRKEKHCRDSVNMSKLKNYIETLNYKKCFQTYRCSSLNAYCCLMSDVVHSVPPELLGSLLYEELTEQRDRMLFPEAATGGALAFVPFSDPRGCLLYPGGLGQNHLNFHKVKLQPHGLDLHSSPTSFQLKAPIRQISSASLFNECCVAVRCDRFCGAWRFSETYEPRLLQVVNTKEVSTCVSVSPHVLGEILVASGSGAANLWTVGKGLQKVRHEDSNLYFNTNSSWRWCEFSAHPRVMLYADRTGAELTDIRANPASGYTLFRISSSSSCRSGERLLLSRYLGDVHPFHHLITTQFSAYIMDERFPCVPMLKWDHMMKDPPIFCHIVPPSATLHSAEGETTKVLIGSHNSQDVVMLQYSGGRVKPCNSHGSIQALLRPKDSLKHLPVQIPHRQDIATNRLSAPVAGLTCIQRKAGSESCREEAICVLQLTEDGDIFYQILEHKLQNKKPSVAPAAHHEHQPAAKNLGTSERRPADSQLVISETSSDEDAIGPTQIGIVPETPDRRPTRDSDSSSEDSGGRDRNMKRMRLQVFVIDDSEVDAGMTNGNEAEKCGDEEVRRSSRDIDQSPMKISSEAHFTWKNWLQKLVLKSKNKQPGCQSQDYFRTKTKDLLNPPDKDPQQAGEKRREGLLTKELESCMLSRSLLLHGSTSSKLPAAVPVPDPVYPNEWTDALSNRLTASWQSEEAWREWWRDQLGTNRKTKVEALKRRRKREKEARRSSGRRLELSGSFTSSVSYQVDLDDFTSTDWSSAASEGAWSDVDDGGALSQLGTFQNNEITSTPLHVDTETLPPTPTTAPSIKNTNYDPQTHNKPLPLPTTQTRSPETTPTNQKTTKRPTTNDLDSLFETQVDASLNNTSPPHAVASSSQFHGSQSVPQTAVRSLRSRNIFSSMASSQTSQASQGPRRASQASQPTKKRSQMGF